MHNRIYCNSNLKYLISYFNSTLSSAFADVIVTPINVIIPPMIATKVGTSPNIKYANTSETAGVKYNEIVASDTPIFCIV